MLVEIIPPNSPQWKELLENDLLLYNYVKQYYEERKQKYRLEVRRLMPVVSQRVLRGGIGERAIIYFNWFMHCQINPLFEKLTEEYSEHLMKTLQCGKLQYLWSKNNDVVSCVNINAMWGLDDRLVWETCHPELRCLTLEEARKNTLRYFKNPKHYNNDRY